MINVKKDLTGLTFGDITVIGRAADMVSPSGRNSPMWKCLCTCGATLIRNSKSIKRKSAVKSCGCLTSIGVATHGMYRTPTHSTWISMKGRCENQSNKDYPRYGGRGIKFCKRWRSFNEFHADMGNKPEGLTLDRIDNDGGYSKENCRWATVAQQNRNKSTTVSVSIGADTYCLAEWKRKLGIKSSAFSKEVKRADGDYVSTILLYIRRMYGDSAI